MPAPPHQSTSPIMLKKEVCRCCGKQIDRARLALDLDTCEACAKEIPGNILRNEDRAVKIMDATIEAFSNVPAPKGVDDRDVRCLKCGATFNLRKDHVCTSQSASA